MEKNRQWKKQVVTALDLAPDLDGGETKISLTGSGEAVIEIIKVFCSIQILKFCSSLFGERSFCVAEIWKLSGIPLWK